MYDYKCTQLEMWGSDLNCIDRTTESETEARCRPTECYIQTFYLLKNSCWCRCSISFHLFTSSSLTFDWRTDFVPTPQSRRKCRVVMGAGEIILTQQACGFACVCVCVGSLNVGCDSDECCLCRAEVCKHSRRRTVPVICLVTCVGFGFSKLDTVSPGKPVQAPFPFFFPTSCSFTI